MGDFADFAGGLGAGGANMHQVCTKYAPKTGGKIFFTTDVTDCEDDHDWEYGVSGIRCQVSGVRCRVRDSG